LYLRAKIRQRLARVGAVALKNSVYVLPRREDCLEDFQWIAQEAVTGGGEAHVASAEFDAATDASLRARFREARSADYAALAERLRAARRPRGASRTDAGGDDASSDLARGRRQFDEIRRVDFFDAPGRAGAEKALDALEERMNRSRGRMPARPPIRTPPGRTWVTRRGVKVDRIASAWLIRRFIDPKARFRFVDPSEPGAAAEIRFDMVGGDFTHEGENCTFETLLARHAIRDAALRSVSEIVHDIDLKDGKFGRPEAAGVEQVLAGLLLAHTADEDRLEQGSALFEGLYESLRRKPGAGR
jgi:hypothetical protein